MRLSTQVKPISYVKANAAQIMDELADGGEPVVVTQNGEAKAVMMSVRDYEQTKETLALLKIIALSREDARVGRTSPADEALARVRERVRAKHG